MKSILKHADMQIAEDKWLKRIDNNIQKTAVQSREVDDSIFNQMLSIMNKKSKYSSVEAAVKDMQERSGLTAYLNSNINKVSSEEKNSKYYQAGLEKGKADNKNNKIDVIASLTKSKEKIPLKKYQEYATGYIDAFQLPFPDRKREMDKVASLCQKKLKNIVAQVNNASVPKLFQSNPAIKNTLQNYIRDSKGNLSIPAIIEKVKSIHQNDAPVEDWEDENLMKFINSLNLKEKKDNPSNFVNNDNLGYTDAGNTSEMDASNNNAFESLMPAK